MQLPHHRSRLLALPALSALVAVAALIAPLGAAASPRQKPIPTVASVTAQLHTLGRTIDGLSEKYNRAQIQVTSAQRAAAAAKRQVSRAAADYDVVRERYVDIVRSDYEGGSQSTTGALLLSGSPGDYLDRLSTMSVLTRHSSEAVASVTQLSAALKTKQAAAATTLSRATALRKTLAAQKSKATAETAKLKTLLATLTAAQQRAYANQGSVSPARAATVKSVHAGNAAAQRAVDFALAQVGKPYAFGAAGPGSYDCSGLVMAAWRAGGVSLPHLASAQINYGTRVGPNDLQAGDLVFLYNPIGHVDIYIGNGMMVSAPQTGENVKVVPFSYYRGDFSGATRLA